MRAAERTSDDHRHFRVGVDVGGTFTDVVLVEETTGEILVAKVATVPADPSEGCIDAIDKAIRNYGLSPGQFVFTVHGTTIATNTPVSTPWTFTDTNVLATETQRFYRAFIRRN